MKKQQFIQQFLEEACFTGLGQASWRAVCHQLSMDQAEACLLFPQGIADVLAAIEAEADAAGVAAIKAARQAAEAAGDTVKIRMQIAIGVQARLRYFHATQSALRHMAGWYALPQHVAYGTKALWRTVDALWYAAGDSATDWNYYTKRVLLAAVVHSTTLYWLQDGSADKEATWAFLDRRIANVLALPKLTNPLKSRCATAGDRMQALWRKSAA